MPCQYSMTRQDADTLRFVTAPAAGDAAAARPGRSAACEVAHRIDVEPIMPLPLAALPYLEALPDFKVETELSFSDIWAA